jgi:hypothetical protein
MDISPEVFFLFIVRAALAGMAFARIRCAWFRLCPPIPLGLILSKACANSFARCSFEVVLVGVDPGFYFHASAEELCKKTSFLCRIHDVVGNKALFGAEGAGGFIECVAQGATRECLLFH